jgi:hypothetical protein
MNVVEELLETVQASGATIRAEGADLKIKPAGILPAELKARLREHKPEVLALLQTRTSDGELERSMRRLQAVQICIAVWEDGSMRIIQSGNGEQATTDGATVYTPRDMYHYIQLATHERRLLHEFKKRFGGTTEWRLNGQR